MSALSIRKPCLGAAPLRFSRVRFSHPPRQSLRSPPILDPLEPIAPSSPKNSPRNSAYSASLRCLFLSHSSSATSENSVVNSSFLLTPQPPHPPPRAPHQTPPPPHQCP